MAELRTAAHHSGVIPARLGGELEARLPVDARRYLLCVRKRKFMITTYSSHGRRIWPNLAGGMVLSDVDQLWRADITYIRLRENSYFWVSFWMLTRAGSSDGHWIGRWKMN